jgi:hypothetical protein
VLGHPVIVGNSYYAISDDDLFACWEPLLRKNFITLAHPMDRDA